MDSRGLLVVCAVSGFMLGMAVCASVLRWIVALAVVGKESTRSPLGWTAALLLHSGPWLLAIVAAIAWNVLSAPHARAWDVLFMGMAASPVLLALVVLFGLRRARRQEPLPKPSTMTGEEQAQWRMRQAVWVALPVFAAALYGGWEYFVRMPELVLVLAAAVYLFSYMMCRIMTVIEYPQPWRLPPKKEPTRAAPPSSLHPPS